MSLSRKYIGCSFLIIVFCLTCEAKAVIFTLTSIEWFVDASDQIVSVKLDDKLNPGPYTVIKTNGSMGLPKLGAYVDSEKSDRWNSGNEILLFSRLNEKKKLVAFHSINLTGSRRSIFEPINMTGKILRTRKAILAAVKSRVKIGRKIPEGSDPENLWGNSVPLGFLVTYPDDCEIDVINFGGIIVPADPEYKKRYIKGLKSKEPRERAYAAACLVNYPDKETIELLKTCLKDPGKSSISSLNEDGSYTVTHYHPVRLAAYDALIALKIKVKKPKEYDKVDIAIHGFL